MLLAACTLPQGLGAQALCIRTKPTWRQESGIVALQQAVRDVGADTQVMLVAAHPDDRYVLPAAYLRFLHGYRVAVVLFTRGRGGQNIKGTETGEALARVRTMESEAGAAHLGMKVYYLNRPDGGFSRTAQEALDQWGRRSTTVDLARLVRTIRPDMVMTTHYPGENHGHDKALLEILPDALSLSADAAFVTKGLDPYRVSRLFRGTEGAREPTTPATDGGAAASRPAPGRGGATGAAGAEVHPWRARSLRSASQGWQSRRRSAGCTDWVPAVEDRHTSGAPRCIHPVAGSAAQDPSASRHRA
ncbi:MAG: PIG-L family deacetylase [Planctomycetota bacterium]